MHPILFLILINLFSSDGMEINSEIDLNLIELDTINYWHILIENEVKIKAVHYTPIENLEININKNSIPAYIEFDYQTDHGFEFLADRLIQIYDVNHNLIEEREIIMKDYDTKRKIEVGTILKNYNSIVLKCIFFFSEEKLRILKRHNSRWLEYDAEISLEKPFIICKIKVI